MRSTLAPYVFMEFPNDPFGRGGGARLDIYTNYLRSLKCHVITDSKKSTYSEDIRAHLTAQPSNSRNITYQQKGYSTRMSEIQMDLFDADFYILESYLMANGPRSDLEFGWIDERGNKIHSYKVPVMITSLTPKVTPTGTALSVNFVSSYLATDRGPKESTLNRKLLISRTFKPGGKARRDADIKQAQAALESAKTQGKNRTNTPKYDENVYYFDRISDIVKLLASQANIKLEIDETPIYPPDAAPITMNGKSIYDMLDMFARSACDISVSQIDPTGGSYVYWFDQDTLYFKRQTTKVNPYGPIKEIKEINYMGQNEVTIEDLLKINSGKTITLDMQLAVKGSMIEALKTRAVSYDPRYKNFRGDSVESTDPSTTQSVGFLRGVLGEDNESVKKANSRVDAYGRSGITAEARSAIVESERLKSANITPMYGEGNQKNWFVYEDAQLLAPQTSKNATEAMFGGYGPESQARNYARYVSQQLDRIRETAANDPQGVSGAIAASDAGARQVAGPPKDPTAVGTTMVMPYYDDRTARAAHQIYQDLSNEQVIEMKATIIGDPTMRRLDKVFVTVNMPSESQKVIAGSPGPIEHYTSGEYMVTEVDHIIDSKGYTTQITGIRINSKLDWQEAAGLTKDELSELDQRADLEQRQADASIGSGGEEVILEERIDALGRKVQLVAVTDDFGSNSASDPYVYSELDPILFNSSDISASSPLESVNIISDGTSLSVASGPNSRNTVRNLMDPNNAINGGVGPKLPGDIFSLPGGDEDPSE